MITDVGIEMIKMFESYRSSRYLDSAGHPTIGYGHLIINGDSFQEPMTEPEADLLLREDIAKHEHDMLQLVHVPLAEYQLDALTSFVFNLGADSFKRSALRACVNDGRPLDAADQFTRWIFAGGMKLRGLIRRRNAEAARFLGGGITLVTSVYKGA